MSLQSHYRPRTKDSLAHWYARHADHYDTMSKMSDKTISKVCTIERHLFNFEQQTSQWKATLRNCWHIDQPLKAENSASNLFATNKKVNPLVHRVTSAVHNEKRQRQLATDPALVVNKPHARPQTANASKNRLKQVQQNLSEDFKELECSDVGDEQQTTTQDSVTFNSKKVDSKFRGVSLKNQLTANDLKLIV